MASRRAAAPSHARTRPQSTFGAPRTRPPSALGKSNASDATTPADDAPVPVPAFSSRANAAEESNIQVVIRCRRRSEKEIQDGSHIVVTSSGPKSSEITVQLEPQTSSLGVVQLPPTRTYPFDMVFGPEADQSMVYNDVVAPMLDEVIGGYNCTVFAYGQTGTGKTHTMQGDLNPTPLGGPSPAAGMIPRALNKLFYQLNNKFTDFSVRVSYIELYNEELRDLLGADFQPPTNASQPMGKGGFKDRDQGGLQIYDDVSKRGVTIQGLNEVTVKDAADAIALLIKGSERRQIASTKFNDHSSRSHTIFTLTVHTKETSLGDDLLKVGKLNLVDLAGAENIGRSGAKNKQAQEAGLINKSLLTLGRVITSLVEKAQHIPYRESKLTRLLQDSLGGRTKTCIIATVSPARCNLEETISTLDYAINAKSIKNKPEINQRMTKNMLLREYVAEMDRLKSDLLAAREKNGIFFAQETWEQMQREQQTLVADLADTKNQLAEVESQLRGAQGELETSMGLLAQSNRDLQATRDSLHERTTELEQSERRLEQTQSALDDEIVVRAAHQETEGRLDGVATGLKGVVEAGIREIEGLHGKLDRKTTLFNANLKVAVKTSSALSEQTKTMQSLLEEFVKTHGQVMDGLAVAADEFRTKEIEALSALTALVKEQFAALRETSKSLQLSEDASAEATAGLQKTVRETAQVVLQGFDAWAAEVIKSSASMCEDIKVAGKASCSVAENALNSLAQLVESLASDAQKHAANEARVVEEVRAMTKAAAADEIQRLKQHNDLLHQMLEREQAEAEQSRDDLVRRVSSMLEDYSRQRDSSLRKAFDSMQQSSVQSETQWTRLAVDQGEKLDQQMQSNKDAIALVQRRRQEGKRKREDGSQAITSIATSFEEGLASLHASTSTAIANRKTEEQEQLDLAQSQYDEGFERLDRAKRLRIDNTGKVFTSVQQTYKTTREVATTSAKRVSEGINAVLSQTTAAERATVSYQSSMSAAVSSVQASATGLDNDTRRDEATGGTPRKHSFTYTRTWELTADRDTLLQARRAGSGKSSSLSHHTLVSESVTDEDANAEASDKEVSSPLSASEPSLDRSEPAIERSTADASENVFMAPAKPSRIAKASGLPLAERPANIVVTRGSRRR